MTNPDLSPAVLQQLHELVTEEYQRVAALASPNQRIIAEHSAQAGYRLALSSLSEKLSESEGLLSLSGDAHMEVRQICAEVGCSAAFVDDAVRQVVDKLKVAEAALSSSQERHAQIAEHFEDNMECANDCGIHIAALIRTPLPPSPEGETP